MPQQEGDAPLVRLHEVGRRFGAVTALDGVSLDVRAGEVHCVLGENGAGKSTLIAMLAGMQQPDTGAIVVRGAPTAIRTPAVSRGLGIRVVYQHSMLVPTLSILENLMLGAGRRGGHRGGHRAALRRSELLLSQLRARGAFGPGPETLVGELGLGERQLLESELAFADQPSVLVLDEPTALLAAHEIDDLFSRITQHASDGGAVVCVTHKLDEVLRIADRVTVLRSGRVVDELDLRRDTGAHVSGESSEGERLRQRIVTSMFGAPPETLSHEPGSQPAHDTAPDPERPSQLTTRPALLRLTQVSTAAAVGRQPLVDFSLEVRQAEVLGIAGIDGHGQRDLARVIAGEIACESGQLVFDGAPVTKLSVAERQRLGIAYVTDDRLGEGTIASMSVEINAIAKQIGQQPFWRRGRLQRAAVRMHAQSLIEEADIRPDDPAVRAGTLSGGNLQKLLLARETMRAPRLLVCSQPTYGLDLHTTQRIRAELRRLAASGTAVVVISQDLDELVQLSDRIVVMSSGQVSDELTSVDERSRDRIASRIAGVVA